MKRIYFTVAVLFAIALSVFMIAAVAAADEPKTYPGPYLADVVDVYDGDTINMVIYVLPGQMVSAGVRVAGVDTPEIGASGCKTEAMKQREKQLGHDAKAFVEKRYSPGQRVRLRDLSQDKFGGRFVAIVERETITGWQRLDDELLRAKLADPYGINKPNEPLTKLKSWCKGE